MMTEVYDSSIYYIRLGIKKNKFEQEIWEIDKGMCRLDILLRAMKEISARVIPIVVLIKTNDIRTYFEL